MTDHVRTNGSPLAVLERRCLVWIARRLPAWLSPDHLSALGLAAMAGAGGFFYLAQFSPSALIGVVLSLALNWFGDSLDGTLARVRRQERPRFGYYVDHVIDMAGAAMLLAGLALSGFMTPLVALALLAAYLLVSAEVYLATHARGLFRMSFLGLGPTELRIVLAVGALSLWRWSVVSPFGLGPWRLFDVGGVIAIAGLGLAFLVAVVRNTRALFRAERPARTVAAGGFLLFAVAGTVEAQPPPEALAVWQQYVAQVDRRVEGELARPLPVRHLPGVEVEAVEADGSHEPPQPPGALVHHWRGRVFVPRVDLETVLARVRDPRLHLAQPDVRAARIVRPLDDGLVLFLRITRSQIVSATYDTEHVVRYRRLDAGRAAATSVATSIVEIEDAGRADERRKAADEDRGFLWALRAWWRYEAVAGGVLIECESVSLSRAVPFPLKPLVMPMVSRFGRDTMVRTLESLRDALAA